MRPLETFIEQRKERFVRNSLMSDEFLDFVNKNMKPIEKQMSYYQCAIMEVETKFKVLNEQYSLEYDRNPIEDIKSRVKSMERRCSFTSCAPRTMPFSWVASPMNANNRDSTCATGRASRRAASSSTTTDRRSRAWTSRSLSFRNCSNGCIRRSASRSSWRAEHARCARSSRLTHGTRYA